MSADCCLMFARTGSHSEFCPAFEENDPAVRVARIRDAAALAEAREALDERRQERDDAHTEIGMLTEQLADRHAALMAALGKIQEIKDLVGGYPPQTEDATKLRDLVWEAVTSE